VKKGSWSRSEDSLILELQMKYGNAWAKITSFLPGRTDNAVKNRYWSATRSKARRDRMSDIRTVSSGSLEDTEGATREEKNVEATEEDMCVKSDPTANVKAPVSHVVPTATTATTATMHFASDLKVTIPTSIVGVDYMSDEELGMDFLDWSNSCKEAEEAAVISPTSSACGSDSGSVLSGESSDGSCLEEDDGLLDVADFFGMGEGFEFDMIDMTTIAASAVPAL